MIPKTFGNLGYVQSCCFVGPTSIYDRALIGVWACWVNSLGKPPTPKTASVRCHGGNAEVCVEYRALGWLVIKSCITKVYYREHRGASLEAQSVRSGGSIMLSHIIVEFIWHGQTLMDLQMSFAGRPSPVDFQGCQELFKYISSS